MKNEVEMHSHSYYSDGYDSPADLARKAKKAGLKAICLTDHDAYQGLPEFLETCEELDIDALPGIEITATYKDALDTHILGYGIDLAKRNILDEGLANSWKMHNEIAEMILQKYSDAGIMSASIEDIKQALERKNYPYISRGDIKKYRFSKFGVPYEQTDDETRWGGIVGVGYNRELLMSPEDAVELIRKAGGRAVLAHPGNYFKKLRNRNLDIDIFYEILDELMEAGLFGMEAHYIYHTEEENIFFEKMAKERDLFITQSSDYHGIYYSAKRPIGENNMPYEDFLKLKEALEG